MLLRNTRMPEFTVPKSIPVIVVAALVPVGLSEPTRTSLPSINESVVPPVIFE